MKKHIAFFSLVTVTVASLCFAQEKKDAHAAHTMVTPGAIKWNASGPGMEAAVVSGSPGKEGEPFVLRLKLRDGMKVPPHWHPVDEHVTVISGTFYMGAGEKFDESAAHEMPAGSYSLMPKETRHFAWAKGETVIQIHGVGPFKTFWVNPPEGAAKKQIFSN
ncbi:MAG TPA: cupin domain-containing protein [Blastocatellia bacterium]|nr:cupin domain-containing protein [Blastocatellia bacterium]